MAAAYEYPIPAMLEASRAGNAAAGRMRGVERPVDTSNLSTLAAPLSFRQRLAILIYGADAGRVFMAPQQPLQPIAQPADMAGIGRQWDYPVGWNTRVTPRTGLPVGFPALRSMADGYDLLRILIERTKDQLVDEEWSIAPKDKKAKRDARCDELEDFLAYPDRQHTWDDWLRMLLEQVLVYDAPAIWLQPTRGGDMAGLQIIDGALVSPKIMADGRLPPPEFGPAYQQVLHGLGAVDYVQPVPNGQPVPLDPSGQPFPELLYRPRNLRVDSPYGYSPVEQIIVTIGIGLRREAFLQSYYTHGSTPDLLIQVPDNWNPDQITQMQSTLDSILAGNLENRRLMRLIPGGAKVVDTREKALTDETDQWLIRICCFAFGLSPMPFVKMMNRASGEQHAEQQKEEGESPYRSWVAGLINHIIRLKWGYRDLGFRWHEESPVDPAAQAEIDASDVTSGIYHPDEIRSKRGDAPMPDDMREQMAVVSFRNAPNATVLPPQLQAEEDARNADRAAAQAAAKPPAPGVAGTMGKGLRAAGSSRSTPRGARY